VTASISPNARLSKSDTRIDGSFDELLVVLVQAGDAAARERLAARWWPRLVRAATRLAGQQRAEDAAQEAMFSIFKGIHGLRDPGKFRAFAFAILRRRCMDQLRQADPPPDTEPELEDTSSGEVPFERLAIAQAMAALPHDQRFAAHLFFAEGLTLSEIAQAQDVPLGTAKSRLFHARRQLKAALSGEDL